MSIFFFQLRVLINRMNLNSSIAYAEMVKLPAPGIYHPDSKVPFETYQDYLNWYRQRDCYQENKSWIGLMSFPSSLIEGQSEPVDLIIRKLEVDGWNVLAGYGKDIDILQRFFVDGNHRSRVELVLAFSLKFHSALNEALQAALVELDVPFISAIHLYAETIEEWRESPTGLAPVEVTWAMTNPEVSGLVEPSVLTGKVRKQDPETGKTLFIHEPISENIDFLLPRLKKWLQLKRKPNKDKKIAILYYNHSQGKQNIGASYLNVFASLQVILDKMRSEGYQTAPRGDLDRTAIQDLVLKYGRNIGNWAPGELEELTGTGKIVRIPINTYRQWFEKLPAEFQRGVTGQWGRVEDSDIMIHTGELIIPAVMLGNVVIMPEPARGWGDDPMKLYHSPVLYPHHQYVAAYLWLQREFAADAVIHLGTHATHEWLPGKQAGLSISCPPEVLITDLPNIYPYIVDDVGEGIQAKRRGRAVVIDHLTPGLREGGLYQEYSRLYELINSYSLAQSQGSRTGSLQLNEIKKMVQQLGLDKDLGLNLKDADTDDLLTRVEHYLVELKANFMPYGMHTFGRSPEADALEDTIKCIIKRNRNVDQSRVKKALTDSGPLEIGRLLRALEGGYIAPGEGNDPVRNTEAIPTGKNFHGFDPARIPSPAAFESGRKAAQGIIDNSLKEKSRYPEKVAVVLWATETIRNEGVNESTILYLMGVKPTWDGNGRVSGLEVIPGRILQRPRIDVLINPSGLYRDLFPQFMLFLDQAVHQAAQQEDIENLIARHNNALKTKLIQQGVPEDRAQRLSMVRIFSEPTGAYGTGVSEMAGASGTWQAPEEIVKVYENRVGYAFSQGQWGEEAKDLLRHNLGGVDVTVHSISSNVYGTMDNDDTFQYLGGLSLAVEKESGKAADTLVSMQRMPGQVDVENIAKTIGRELRTRYLNPRWIEGMKKEEYAGAREMDQFLQNMWGWQVTVTSAIDESKWHQAYQVYVEDKYRMGLKDFFNQVNPWAYQSMTARMLEAVRKDYWKADEKTRQKLAVEYVTSVVEKGVACCDHTCNNPLLSQMVVNIVSIPGIMAPHMVERFKIAMEKATGKKLSDQLAARRELHKTLNAEFAPALLSPHKTEQPPVHENEAEQAVTPANQSETVKGYKLEEVNQEDAESSVSSSGVQWFASLFVVAVIGLFFIGVRRHAKK
ncbi:cobaltochelatase subunit CobN [Desulfoferrobacter suflitae]|uniref:cobaltochelatase subunit CobN n=1 Tax=Desulfoferrobacter suflitae TaxID=2865782 RepID=UPI0021644A4B|nr:cobaltochelatase subunit CobN [Desulfoferrobacter suflitae]MCK8604335.1 cobaltochelatase subunit CobN [Desulfoferrobacter suflitae]